MSPAGELETARSGVSRTAEVCHLLGGMGARDTMALGVEVGG